MQVSGSGSIVAGRVPKRSAAASDVGAAATATCATQVDVDLLVGDEADILPYYPSQGTTTQPFTGSSSKTNVVDFISGTTLRAFGAGTATVTITSGGRTVTATITVVASAKAVCPALTPTGPCISSVSLAVGEQKTVYARTTGSAVLTPGFWVLNHPIVDPILYLVDNRIVLTGRTAGTQALLMYWTGSTIIGSPVSLQVTVTP
jgi:hypothetical protein